MHKRFTFLPPTLPPEWEETVLEQDKQIVMLQTFITSMLILVAVLAIAYQIFKKCRYVSSLPRVCFPVYPVSNFLRGTARTDIFVEIVNLSSGQSMWAYFATCAVHPSQLRITGYPNARDICENMLRSTIANRLAEHCVMRFVKKCYQIAHLRTFIYLDNQ